MTRRERAALLLGIAGVARIAEPRPTSHESAFVGPLLAASPATERAARPLRAPRFLGLLACLSLAGTAFLTVAWYVLVRSEELGCPSPFFLVPVFGLGRAVWLLGETVSRTQGARLLRVVVAVAAAASPTALAGRAPAAAGRAGG